MTVNKKIKPDFMNKVLSGDKNFEIRKDEDNIQVGDVLFLQEWIDYPKDIQDVYGAGFYTGRYATRPVKYVMRNCPEYGLMDGYCIIGF